MTPRLSFLDPFQTRKIGADHDSVRDKLESFQLEMLKYTVRYAVNHSRFYSERLKHVDVESMLSLDDITALPFTLPSDLREKSLSFLCVSQEDILRIVTLQTSGTTAQPKRLFFTGPDLEKTLSFFSLVLSQLILPSEKALILLPGNTPASAGDLLCTAMNRIDGKGILHGPVFDFNDALDQLMIQAPSLIIGMPVQVLALCSLIESKGVNTNFLRHVILTSDHASRPLKKRVAETLSCPVIDHYGLTEAGYGGGIDCLAHRGYHLRETDLFFEIIDPDTEKPVPEGSWGEIVLTTLNRQGMPLIRYRTGDMSRFLTAPCPCGSLFRRMDYIRYRYSHSILLPGNIRFGIPDLDDILFNIPGVLDFDANLVPIHDVQKLNLTLKMQDSYRKHDQDLKTLIFNAPFLQKVIATGLIRPGTVRTEPFQYRDTYVSKRSFRFETS
jgi:phenylacetate-coenzyme A ligase PaaK-like adenylate-forming protein